jgi:hypothetical protein
MVCQAQRKGQTYLDVQGAWENALAFMLLIVFCMRAVDLEMSELTDIRAMGAPCSRADSAFETSSCPCVRSISRGGGANEGGKKCEDRRAERGEHGTARCLLDGGHRLID